MSELLRKANELIEARARAGQGEWKQEGFHVDQERGNYIQFDIAFDGDIEFIVLAANHAVDVIKGYQGLLRRVIDGWNQKYYHSDDVERYRILKAEIERSLPGDESYE